MDERTVRLNELAQGMRPLGQGVAWFEDLAHDEQFEVLRDLSGFCVQARATVEDSPESVRVAGIRPTWTPTTFVDTGSSSSQCQVGSARWFQSGRSTLRNTRQRP